jgi:ribosomal protein S27AE
MPQPNRPNPSPLPPLANRRCPSCGLQLFMSRIEPTDRDNYEERTYECGMCAYAETVTVKFR